MNYLLPFLLTALLSVFLTGIFKRVGIHYGILSIPRARDVHKKPVPRIGGLAIFISFLVISLLYFSLIKRHLSFGGSELLGVDKRLLAIFLGGLWIVFIMFWDDLRGLKPWQKLLSQVLAALIVISSGIGINSLTNPFGPDINLNSVYVPIFVYHGITYHFSLLSDLLTLFWLVGMMNVINFIDGVDGLAGGVSGIGAITIFLLSISVLVNQPAMALVSIILAGSCAGFLVWNFPPAKIFMGDSGSNFLGFMLGVLPLISGGKLATTFLVLGFPIVDGILVVAGRIVNKKNPFSTPDKTHLHHRFLRAGFTPRQAIVSIYIISAAFGWVALRSTTERKIFAALVLIVFVMCLTQALKYFSSKKKTILANNNQI